MNTDSNMLAGRNYPVAVVDGWEDVEVKNLDVKGTNVEFRVKENGSVSVGKKEVRSKAHFHTFETIRGFLSGLATVMDSENGVFVSGFHMSRGYEYVRNVWDADLDQFKRPVAVAYVDFDLLSDVEVIKWLAGMGIRKGGSKSPRMVLGAARGKLFYKHPYSFEKKDAFVERISGELGIEAEWKAIPFNYRDSYDKAVATWHKRIGIEATLRILAGTLKGVINPNFYVQDWQAPRLTTQFEGLWGTKEERQARYNKAVDNKNLYGQYVRARNELAEDDTVRSEYIQSVESTNTTELWVNGEVKIVDLTSLENCDLKFVKPNGLPARAGQIHVTDSFKVLGACALAEQLGAYLAKVG